MLQCDDTPSWWVAQGTWPTGGLLEGAGLGADAHVRRARGILERAEPAQWRAAAARAFEARLSGLVRVVHLLGAEVADVADRVAELEAELAAAGGSLHAPGPWWAAR